MFWDIAREIIRKINDFEPKKCCHFLRLESEIDKNKPLYKQAVYVRSSTKSVKRLQWKAWIKSPVIRQLREAPISVTISTSASGICVSHLMASSHQNMKANFLHGNPSGTIGSVGKCGWIKVQSFIKCCAENIIVTAKHWRTNAVVLAMKMLHIWP
jgi:hypothetical protein